LKKHKHKLRPPQRRRRRVGRGVDVSKELTKGNIEEKLDQLGGDAQLAIEQLQHNLQKQQQTLQMLSNISKELYDTAQSVIRKTGG